MRTAHTQECCNTRKNAATHAVFAHNHCDLQEFGAEAHGVAHHVAYVAQRQNGHLLPYSGPILPVCVCVCVCVCVYMHVYV